MTFPILLLFIPRVLSMNPISALGHSVLAKKYGANKPQSHAVIRASISYASPSHPQDKHAEPCSPFSSCVNSPERVADAIFGDTPKSIDIKLSEDQLEECLREKADIDRVLTERAKLGPFLTESIERPVIDDMMKFNESVEAFIAKLKDDVKTKYFYDNIDIVEQKYQCYGLNRIDVIAIRLYTTAVGFVVNEVLRNYSLYDMPISTAFLPYIYALINGLSKLDRNRETCDSELQPLKVVRYISVKTLMETSRIEQIFESHQRGAYVMYPAFTSSAVNDLAKDFYSGRLNYRFEIQAKTAIIIRNLSLYPNEFEAVFLPGTVFRVLERDDQHFVMEEIVLEELNARRAQLPC